MYANYHTHTKRCKHATGEDREYVEAAIEAGIEILGFSDHCPWVYPKPYESGIRMDSGELESYVHSLSQLRQEYADDIKIFIGLEAEYIPELMDAQDRFLAEYPLDYMILGQHFLGAEQGSVYAGMPMDDADYLERYVDAVIEGMDSGRYLYLAHPDLVNYTGDSEIYALHMRRLLSYLLDNGYPFEINMLGAWQGRNYPDPRFLQLAGEMGNECLIGVDAHDPQQLCSVQGEQICEKLIEKYGLQVCEPPLI